MTINLVHDKNTGVAFVDICEAKQGAQIRLVDVTETLGLKTQVMARIDADEGTLLGLMIEDYPAFKREIMRKYVALAVERIIDLIVTKVKESLPAPHRSERLLASY
jgi:hypothetical protein